VPAAAVRLERRRPGGSFRPVRRAATANDGSAIFTDRPTSTTTYRVVFAGDVTHQATTSAAVTISLAPRVKLHRRHGRLRAAVRTPWGAALRSTTLKLQQRHGHHWRTVRRLHVNRRGIATAAVRRGQTYRIRYGGGGWQRGHTHPVKAR
jgi:hypothetical protein